MIVRCANQCAYCRSPILSGQRWVREKIYDPALDGRDASYPRYHAEPFAGQEGSCWEKHQMEQEIARTPAYAGYPKQLGDKRALLASWIGYDSSRRSSLK